jgi:hypothetical protein
MPHGFRACDSIWSLIPTLRTEPHCTEVRDDQVASLVQQGRREAFSDAVKRPVTPRLEGFGGADETTKIVRA